MAKQPPAPQPEDTGRKDRPRFVSDALPSSVPSDHPLYPAFREWAVKHVPQHFWGLYWECFVKGADTARREALKLVLDPQPKLVVNPEDGTPQQSLGEARPRQLPRPAFTPQARKYAPHSPTKEAAWEEVVAESDVLPVANPPTPLRETIPPAERCPRCDGYGLANFANVRTGGATDTTPCPACNGTGLKAPTPSSQDTTPIGDT